MLPIIKEVKNKIRTAKGFTLVELMVVLVILAILAALAGAGITAYVRLARFDRNESNARTVFQTAQIALTRKDTSGDMDTFLTQLRDTGVSGGHFTADGLKEQFPDKADEKAQAFNSQIFALYYDKNNPDSPSSQMVHDLLSPYVYDDTLFSASMVVEIDSLSGQVYSAFYDTMADKLRFAADADPDGAVLVDDRSYNYRRHNSLVGYYSAEDTVNVVTLRQTQLKVKNPQLINNETLTLNWSGNSKNGDLDTIYDAAFYTKEGKPLFKLEIVWAEATGGTNKNAAIRVYRPVSETDASQGWQSTDIGSYTFPLSYSKGRFILTLDAMCDANLLRAAENDNAQLTSTKTTLFSITRLTQGAQDIYVEMQARPYKGFENTYTDSKIVRSNTENTLFALGSDGTQGTLKYFRHLYNLRWVKSGTYTFNSGSLLAANQNTTLDWTGGGVTVYCAADNGGEPVAKVPSRTGEVVAWPTISTLARDVTLTGSNSGSGHVIISNLQLRGSSVAAQERTNPDLADHQKRDHYVGLIGENNGTLKNVTLRDPDVQVNAEVKAAGEQATDAMAMDAGGTQYLQVLDEKDTGYRQELWSVGALAGVDTGSITDCTVDRSSRRGAQAKVTAALSFSSLTTGTDRKDDKTTTSIYDEPHGIGGLVGFAMPESGSVLTGLTLDQNVTVAGLFRDEDAGENTGTAAGTSHDTAEKERYNAIADAGKQSLWRAVGVGGVAGVLDATNLAGTQNAENLKNITNKATVVGNAFVGGIAGNLYTTAENTENTENTLTGLANQGTVLAGANYQGSTPGQSQVLGQFFGGIAGYARNLVLDGCHSATRSGLSEAALTTLVQAGYEADGSLNESSPLKGDFVGGLVGFGRDIRMTSCYTESGYVLGRSFVGGFVGGFVGSDLYTRGGVNNSYVFGNRYVGGIVSVNGRNSTIDSMTNKGLVAGLGADAAYVGGIAGVNDATWGANDTLTGSDTATLVDSANSMSTVEVTDKNKIELLKTLSVTADGTPRYADFVGGVAGYNGTNGHILWQADSDKGAVLGAVLYGGSYVGGVAGYNDATATIENEHTNIPSVTGTIVATGDCVGGVVGLNGAAGLPAVQVSANRIEGVHFVGGIIGANLPAEGFSFVHNGAAAAATTIGTGRLVADGVAGGIIGYNRVVSGTTLKDALQQENSTLAADLKTLLPTFDEGTNALNESGLTSSDKAVTLTGLTNSFNIYANAYVGGILGYNANGTRLTLVNAVNGSAGQAQSYGGLAQPTGDKDIVNSGAYRLQNGVQLTIDAANRGYYAGGILGYTTAGTTLENCTNYGGVQHKVAAGGLTGANDGTITGGSMANSMGSQQNSYLYLGGIAGINNGSITNAVLTSGCSIRGGTNIGGVAGYNTQNGVITLDTATGSVYGITAAGGVAGYNAGRIVPGKTDAAVTVQVTGTAQIGGLAGVNAAGSRIGGEEGRAYYFTIANAARISSANFAGGAAGENYGTIYGVTNSSGSVQVSDRYVGGITGRNYGTVNGCLHNATGSRALYAGGGYAGGIAGSNENNALLTGVSVAGTVTAANGEAGGVTAHNYGKIQTPKVGNATVNGTSDAIGGVAAMNEAGAVIDGAILMTTAKPTTLNGPATKVGGLVGYNAGTVQGSTVNSNSLTLTGLTAADNTVTAGGALGENTGTATDVNVSTDLTQSMTKYKNLGGVAGSSSGALVQCTYTGAIGTGTNKGLAAVGSTVGGIVGLNEVVYGDNGAEKAAGKVENCTVGYIRLQVQGASNAGASQDADTKINNAAHIGGIAGRNCGTITGSTVGTGKTLGSVIAARHGFVGGVAGSNSGTITTSGGEGTKELVAQIKTWLTDAGDTAKQNENLNAMVRVLTGKAKGTEEITWQKKFVALKGEDTVSDSTKQNQLKVTLQGGSSSGDFANGYLGGITGFNDVSGQITDSASGQWFVYADNINQSWGAVGGIIGQNESNVDSTSGLVNFAAVRRYVRGDWDSDDDWNSGNKMYTNLPDNYVGGIIGTQENRTDDRWTLEKCVNIGTVFNSRSNNAAGVLAYWVSYGGTLQNCYNFGDITTNSNKSDADSGTVGGIVGYFNTPVSGTAANLYKCQNYGSVKMQSTGANDVGGIFGKVQLQNKNDAMTINITECVNGAGVKLNAKNMAVGIFSYIGPYDTIPNVEVNIDRCRNYCYELSASNAGSIKAGIFGNRGNPANTYSSTDKKTTITNCFTLVTDTTEGRYRTICYSDTSTALSENCNNNYYMDKYSFLETGWNQETKGLTELDRRKSTDWQNISGYTSGASDKELPWVQGRRLFAGTDNGASEKTDILKDKDGNVQSSNYHKYFGVRLRSANSTEVTYNVGLDKLQSNYVKIRLENEATGKWGDPASKRLLTTGAYQDGDGPQSWNYAGQILLLFDEVDGDNAATMADVTDEALQNYYTYLLDTGVPTAPRNLQVTKSDDTTTAYGRYTLTWDAPAEGSPTYYKVRVYSVNEDGTEKETLIDWTNVYEKRFTFEGQQGWTGSFNVEVIGVNTKGDGAAATLPRAEAFYKTLPTPEFEVRLVKNSNNSFSQVLVLKNADAYNSLMTSGGTDALTNWTVTAYTYSGADKKATYTFTNNSPVQLAMNTASFGSRQTLRGEATSTDADYMRSARYDESIYIPTADVSSRYSGWTGTTTWSGNPGLAQGSLDNISASAVRVTGTTIDDLTFTATLNFTTSVSGAMPVYRVMLMGRYTGGDSIGGTGTNGASLNGQYITLAARQAVVPNSDTTFTFNNLPEDTLTSYDRWMVVAVPVTSGVGDVTTRWDADESEVVRFINSSGTNNIAAWYGGYEIVRESDGSYSYAHLTPLYFANSSATNDGGWAAVANSNRQILCYTSTITVAKAPKLEGDATYTLNENNELEYTFTWTQPGETYTSGGSSKYKLTMYGITDSGTEEPITLPDNPTITYDSASKTYSYTLNVDTDLSGGSSSWRFGKVRLRVTRDTSNATGTGQSIGAADTATYAVVRRMEQVGALVGFSNVDASNAEQLRYEISWPAVMDETGDLDQYELWAREQNATGTLGEAFRLYPADADENGDIPPIREPRTVVDLEAYQGKTLVFYVVACPKADRTGVLRSPNGVASAPQTILQRTDAPTIANVSFTWPDNTMQDALPLMNAFCNSLTIQMDVGTANADSYFFTGYLFDEAADYTAACDAANTWMADPNKTNLDALNAALAKGTRMIPDSSRTVGSETTVSGSTVSYAVTPKVDSFTMQPSDANRYLLPALRVIVAGGDKTSSSWHFYVPQDTADNALHLPKIQLDKPEKEGIASLTSVESTVTGSLYANSEGIKWDPETDAITIHQYAVQWPAVNEYTAADLTTHNFAGVYRFHVDTGNDMADTDPNKGGYDIRFTVAQADTTVENGDGTTTDIPRGEILKVEKLPANADETDPNAWLDITDAARHTENADTDNEYTWYDLSIAKVQVPELDAEGNPVNDGMGNISMKDELLSQPITLTGHHAMGNDNPIYKIDTVPALRMAEMSDGSLGYRVTLPDLSERAEGDTDMTTALAQYTNGLTVWAVGDGEKTTDSEQLAVTITRSGSTQAMPETALPVVTMASPEETDTPANDAAPAPDGTADGAGEGIATPETAAPAA